MIAVYVGAVLFAMGLTFGLLTWLDRDDEDES